MKSLSPQVFAASNRHCLRARDYIQDENRRQELHNILEDLKDKGYLIPEPTYKRMPRECDGDDPHSYLYRMGAVYAYTTYPPDETFHSKAIIERNFNIYEDMFALQQWVYEMTLYQEVGSRK